MGSGEVGADRKKGFHGDWGGAGGEQVDPERVGFVQTQPYKGQLGGQAGPDGLAKGFGSGQLALRTIQIELRPSLVEVAKIELGRHLSPNRMLHLREIEHHAVRIERTSHGHHQGVVVAVAGGQAAESEAGQILFSAELRQPVAMTGAERGPPGNYAGAAPPVAGAGRVRRET